MQRSINSPKLRPVTYNLHCGWKHVTSGSSRATIPIPWADSLKTLPTVVENPQSPGAKSKGISFPRLLGSVHYCENFCAMLAAILTVSACGIDATQCSSRYDFVVKCRFELEWKKRRFQWLYRIQAKDYLRRGLTCRTKTRKRLNLGAKNMPNQVMSS